jgi:WD40 repeat protein
MGGLVIKRAYILAKQKEEFFSIANRVRAIFFLATPHRGADLAQLLTKILNLSAGQRPFVTDLHRNSLATQSINDEFPNHCQELQLYSFYETLPTNYGVGKSLVVDKDLATLGYSNERTAYLNANHREVCKYSTSNDPNYLIVRNALAATIDGFRIHAASSKHNLDLEQRKLLEDFLGVSDVVEDDLMGATAQLMTGSCEWLLKKDSFQEWRDSANTQLYWISAKPATGKTILSGKVITHLRDLDRDCAFYFFNYGNKAKSTISSFLLSMAWQMALMHVDIFRTVLEICKQDHRLGAADHRTIWRKLYSEGILKVSLVRPQYWVVDALDECQTGSDLVPLLTKIIEMCPVRIFLTSRDRYEVHRQIIVPKIKVVSEEIKTDDTKSDIVLFLQANMDHLPSADNSARNEMVTKILTKSDGCFLWVRLVLKELRKVHTSAEIRQVLEDVPSHMDELYIRILDAMSRAPYGKALAKAILTWTVCSARPLTVQELHHALQLNIGDTVDNAERAITSNCDQLVYVDSQSRVKMVHQTAREFLLRAKIDSEFAIDRSVGHRQLAATCLEYLSGNEMRGPRHRKLSTMTTPKERSPFVDYASNSLFEHIIHVSSTDDEFFLALAKFLNSSNVLSWIEYVGQNSDLNRLIQTGKALRNLLQRRSKHMSPIGKEVALVDSWATDLGRLVTKFGKNISAYPSSIFHLIPPFCPAETAPRRQFAASARGIAVIGLRATTWDDCLSTIVNYQEQFSALACSDKYFAIGMNSGNIAIFNETTCQEVRKLKHEEPVRLLHFGSVKEIFICSGTKLVCVWSANSWELLWKFTIPQLCMSLALTDDDQLLLGALRNNHLMVWDLIDGTLRDSTDWTQGIEGQRAHAFRRPIAAAICTESYLLAVVYRGQDILLWDLERDALHDTYSKETGARAIQGRKPSGPGAVNVVFSKGPSTNLLAAAYSDGDIVLFDTSEGYVIETTLANAHTLASSPDGRTLACGDTSGTIQLFDFETLKLLHRITSDDYGISALVFSGDSHRLLDIRGSQCRVWDPMVLVRQDIEDETSDTVSVSTTPQETRLDPSEGEVLVTSLVCHDGGNVFFCGKEDGSVYLYEAKSGQQTQKIFSHADGVSVVSLCFDDKSQIISSIDSSSRVMSHRLVHKGMYWEVAEPVFDFLAGVTIEQLLCDEGHTRILVTSARSDVLWSISAQGNTIIATISWENREPSRWVSHPLNRDQLILISGKIAHLYEWRTLQRLTDDGGILLEGNILPELTIRSIISCFNGKGIATTFRESGRSHSKSRLLLWNTSDFAIGSKRAAAITSYHNLAEQVDFLIGPSGQKLLFLHSNSWICSIDQQNGADISRHFFLPADWLSTNIELMIKVTSRGDIIFVKRAEVAVIKRGLENIEQETNDGGGRRPSLRGWKRQDLLP